MAGDERTRVRDDSLSLRHRTWGFNVPCLDLDFIVAEYDARKPVALIDYKYGLDRLEGALRLDERDNLAVLARLADAASLPAFAVCYDRRPWRFRVHPLNDRARETEPRYQPNPDVLNRVVGLYGQELSEVAFVRFLYLLRGRRAPADVEAFLLLPGPETTEVHAA